MNNEEDILKEIPKDYRHIEICRIIAGSQLYGLNTPASDIDYRTVYKTTNPIYIYGLRECKTFCSVSDEIDETHYELRHFMALMKKTNTQMAEMMFAEDSAFLRCDDTFKIIRENKYSLLDSEKLFKSLCGYLHNERRLTLGERQGRLGGKRKASIDERGFSHKNAVQFIRLCEVGAGLFLRGEYIVSMKEHSLYPLLMEIKTNPNQFSKKYLEGLLDLHEALLYKAYEEKKFVFEFNEELAGDILKNAYV